MSVKLAVQYLDNYAGTPLAYGTQNAAGLDLPAGRIEGSWVVPAGGSRLIPTGVAMAIPVNHYGQVVMRSGHGIRRDLSCHVGTIDADYRGEIMVLVRNHGVEDREIAAGERFAQLIVQPCLRFAWIEEGALPETARGAAGFGSTGT